MVEILELGLAVSFSKAVVTVNGKIINTTIEQVLFDYKMADKNCV